MELERSSGLLVHVSSLPSSYGIGDFGPDAYKFIDFLVQTKQKLWQILPITPTNSPSPYSSMKHIHFRLSRRCRTEME
jgi:4-alpha-glucanotransferase